ncbi:hypothetical protein Q3G72_024572 [Acer saccharum]|nr:hypothetical protein Q3G72_024572 [Acer saccharum]
MMNVSEAGGKLQYMYIKGFSILTAISYGPPERGIGSLATANSRVSRGCSQANPYNRGCIQATANSRVSRGCSQANPYNRGCSIGEDPLGHSEECLLSRLAEEDVYDDA